MRSNIILMTAAVLTACAPAAAFSQQQGTGTDTDTRGAAQNAPQTNNNALPPGTTNGQFGDISRDPWFSDPATRLQLQLNDRQFEELRRLYDLQYEQYRQRLAQQLEADLDAEQSATRRRELRQRFHRDLSNQLDEEFTDEPFRDRFRQLNRQFQGFGAFADPDVQQSLGLTAQQRARLNRLDAEWDRRVQQLTTRHRNNPQQLQRHFAELQRARARQLRSVLAEEQLEAWNRMVGDPFDFPATSYIPGSSQTVDEATRLRGRGPDGVTRPGTSTVPDVSP